jgi:hypothetical protein
MFGKYPTTMSKAPIEKQSKVQDSLQFAKVSDMIEIVGRFAY